MKPRAWYSADTHRFWEHAEKGDYLWFRGGWRRIWELRLVSHTVVLGE